MKGLAVGLWLTSDITSKEIVTLKKESLMDYDWVCIKNPTVFKKNQADDYIALEGRREMDYPECIKASWGQRSGIYFYSWELGGLGKNESEGPYDKNVKHL